MLPGLAVWFISFCVVHCKHVQRTAQFTSSTIHANSIKCLYARSKVMSQAITVTKHTNSTLTNHPTALSSSVPSMITKVCGISFYCSSSDVPNYHLSYYLSREPFTCKQRIALRVLVVLDWSIPSLHHLPFEEWYTGAIIGWPDHGYGKSYKCSHDVTQFSSFRARQVFAPAGAPDVYVYCLVFSN